MLNIVVLKGQIYIVSEWLNGNIYVRLLVFNTYYLVLVDFFIARKQ